MAAVVLAVQQVLFDGIPETPFRRALRRISFRKPYGPRKPTMRQVLFKPRTKPLSDEELSFVMDFFMPDPIAVPDSAQKSNDTSAVSPRRTWTPPVDAVEQQLDLLPLLTQPEETLKSLQTDDHIALARNVLAIHDKLLEVSLHALADDRCSDDLRFEILNWIAHPGFENGVLLPFSFEACCQCTGTDSEEMRVRIKRMFTDLIRELLSKSAQPEPVDPASTYTAFELVSSL